jgi:hypothetical protein
MEPPALDPGRASIARVYDFLLGGKDHFSVDREVGLRIAELLLSLGDTPRANRRFMVRAVTAMARAGIPMSPNLHEVAQQVAGDVRVVYVDNDPVVLVHARALMSDEAFAAGRGVRTAVVKGDACRPDEILDDPRLRARIDLNRPVAVLMVALLHLLPDEEAPGAVRAFRQAMATGSLSPSASDVPRRRRTRGSRPRLSVHAGVEAPALPRRSGQRLSLPSTSSQKPPRTSGVQWWRTPANRAARRS